MAVDPIAQLLLACARAVPREREDRHALQVAADAVPDWQAALDVATQHGLVGVVYRVAKRAPLELPGGVLERWRQAQVASIAHRLALDAELQGLLAALAEVGVPAIVLKGPALARTIYPDPGLRPYTDLDLAVPRAHEARALEALGRIGLTSASFRAAEWQRRHGAHVHDAGGFHHQLVSSTGLLVELHLDPLQLGLRPAAEEGRWARAVTVPGLGGALMLAPEDQVVQLAVHAHKHGFNRLIWLKDLDLLLRAEETRLRWELVEQGAGLEGVCSSVWYALLLAGALLGTPLPAAHARLRPSRLMRALYAVVWPVEEIAGLRGRMRRRAVQFDPAESWRGMLPGLVLMGRRWVRARALFQALVAR